MATKSSSTVGKEKKGPSSNSSTKRITKPCLTSSTVKATTNPSEKQVPNYLKPTISSLHESCSFKQPRSNAPSKAALDRRRSFDKPQSPSRLLKQQQQPSPSRQHNALLSPGHRSGSLNRCTTHPVKTSIPSKPISERLSKIPKEGKRVQPLITKSAKKSSSSLSTSNSKNATKSTVKTMPAEVIQVENEPEVKEAINEENREDERVENQENEVETVSDIQPHVDTETEHNHAHDQHIVESDQPQIQDDNETEHNHAHNQNIVESDQPQIQVDNETEHNQAHNQNLVESDQPQIQVDNEKVIPTVPEEEEEEASQEQIKDEHKENDNTTNQEECNISESDHQETNHSITEEVEVKEKEEESVVITEDHKNESSQEEEKEEVKGETSEEVKSAEGKEEHEQVESEVKEAKVEPTKPKQQEGGVVHGKKECHSPVSNDVIEETANKLLERKNKVRALAGAFQTVIDYQTK